MITVSVQARHLELLTRAEVAALLDAASGLKARTLLMAAYASGQRVSELCALRGRDIKSAPERMCIRVVQGKGGRDHLSLLTPDLLEALRLYWRTCRRGAGRDDWLFAAASDPLRPLDSRVAQRDYYQARHAAGQASPRKAASTRWYIPLRTTRRRPARSNPSCCATRSGTRTWASPQST